MRTPGVLKETDLELLRTLRIISAESPGKCKGKKGDKEEMVILYIVILYNLYQQGGIWTNVGFF